MTVKAILDEKGRDVVTIHPDEAIGDAVRLMASRRIGAVVAVRADGGIAGILSERGKQTFHAVHVEGALVGPTMFSGAGAGAEPTAVSVVADIIDVARNILADSAGRVAPGCVLGVAIREFPRLPPEELSLPYYIRLSVDDDAGVLAEVASALGQNRVSIEAVVQTVQEAERSATVVLLTHEARETDVRAALALIAELPALREPPVVLRIVR